MLSPAAYYNENDEYAAQWLRNLIDAGHIASGVVDTRSIEDVHPRDLDGFTQCHFFAGIGVWSYALRLAGWPDDRPVWSGSCPCQPFSSAGKGAGFADERHLWPAWFHLISERRPPVIFGEQVASPDIGPWLDLVQDDMESLGHAFGAVPFPAAGVGAPHIRDRLYWVAYANGGAGREGRSDVRGRADRGHAQSRPGSGSGGVSDRLADMHSQRCGEARQRSVPARGAERTQCGSDVSGRPGPTNGHWRTADWIACRDGRWRPIEPGTFPLAHGASARVGQLRAYGNAINAQAAAAFVMAAAGGSDSLGGRDVAPRADVGS